MRDRDGLARRPLSDVFQPDALAALRALSKALEDKSARQKNPHPPDTLAFAAWVCARLGGWTGYYGKPGPVVMLNGLRQFKAIQQGWSLAQYVCVCVCLVGPDPGQAMAALAASRCSPDLGAFYQRLIGAGKPPKLALAAVMRKLLTLANTLIRENRKWTPSRP